MSLGRRSEVNWASIHNEEFTANCTLDDLRRDEFEYIELFYNPKRKHTNNSKLSPVEFEIRQQKLNKAGA